VEPLAGFASLIDEIKLPDDTKPLIDVDSCTLPGLAFKSVFVGTPLWKSDCVVSVRQALTGAMVSAKFFIVVPLSVTTTGDCVAGL
jgi:hypothetical protein